MGEGLIGREAELAEVDRFLDHAAQATAALVLEGEAGIGKTALWEAAVVAARRRSFRVLTARPAQAEAKLSFAVLGDLLEEVADDVLAFLPEPQRQALEVALLRRVSDGHQPDHRTVSVAVVGALRQLSAAGPLLVAIDDAQWLDVSSTKVLRFAARRLAPAPVGLLSSRRLVHGDEDRLGLGQLLPDGALHELAVCPLTLAALHQVVVRRLGVTPALPVMAKIHRTSGGNPLYGIELARALGDHEAVAPGQPLPVPGALQALLARRLAALPPLTRRALATVAALGHPTASAVEAALGRGALAMLEPAMRAGVVERDENRIAFRHPLLATTAHLSVSVEQRRSLHRRLATVVSDPEERARHLALAAEGADEDVAGALEAAASLAASRGAPDAAAELGEQSCQMTPTGCAPELRRRLVATAGHSLAAGDLFRARALLEEVIAASPPGPARADALRLLGEVRFQGDSCAEATRHLDQALAEAGDGDRLGALIGLDLAFTLVGLADIAAARHHAHTAVGHAERMDDPGLLAQALGVAVMVDFLSGHGVDEARLERALALEVPDDAMVVLVRPSLIAALIWTWIGQLGRSRPAFERLWRLLVDRGEEAGLPNLSLFAAFTECLAGDLRRAGRYADDGLEAAGLVGGSVPLGMALSAQSLVHAYAGQPDAARDEAKEAVALLAGSGWRTSQAWPLGALGFLEVSLGNAAAAERALAPVTEMMSASGCSDPATSAFVPDEVEALVALGELDRAEVLLDRFDGQARAHDRAWALATSARCRGLLQVARGDLNAAMRSLEQALVEHKRVPLPLERGRTLLVMGQVQRRRKEKRAAKASLASALATFEGIGAAIWVGRAQAELARVGLRPSAPLDLTATEARVAELAASGLTTRQVAAQVFLTPKSVEGVLARIYRKLGVTSRAGLANRLSRADATS